MLMWLIEHTLLNLPSDFWLLFAILGFIAFFFAQIFSYILFLRPYIIFIKPIGGLLTLVSVFMYGGTEINNIWQERMEKAKIEAKIKDEELQEKNDKLVEFQQKTANELKAINAKRNVDIGKLDAALKNAIRENKNNQTVTTTQIVIQNLSEEERKKYELMSEEKKQEYESQINELLSSLKNCPVPKMVVDEINKTIDEARGLKK